MKNRQAWNCEVPLGLKLTKDDSLREESSGVGESQWAILLVQGQWNSVGGPFHWSLELRYEDHVNMVCCYCLVGI